MKKTNLTKIFVIFVVAALLASAILPFFAS